MLWPALFLFQARNQRSIDALANLEARRQLGVLLLRVVEFGVGARHQHSISERPPDVINLHDKN